MLSALILITFAGSLAIANAGASGTTWLMFFAGLLLGISALSGLSWLSLGALWLFTALVLTFLGFPALRRRWLSRPLLAQFRRVMPPMSATEQTALDAGSVWWDGELFSGRPNWERLLAVPPPRLSARERAFLDGPTETLCRLLDDWRITHEDKDLRAKAWRYIRKQGFFGMIIPEEYGGLGFSSLAHSEVVMKLASRSVAAAVTVMVPNSLGPGKLLLHYGTQPQRDHYLPRLAKGEEIPCFALTGPEAGSDAGALPDRGVVCHGYQEGEKVLGIRLNWNKRYITLGPVATLIGLAFRLYDPEHLLGEAEDLGITLALVPRNTSGVDIGQRHVTLDIPFQNGPIRGRNVFVPIEAVIGGRDGIGQGWRMLMESLAEGRGISLPALAVGASKTASRYTGAYARIRRQFGLPIGEFEGVQEALARIAAHTYQMDAARLFTLGALDSGEKPSVVSAIVKYHLTEGYRRIVNDAMDVQGGSGICLGPANLLGRAYQAIPIAITVEGANILTRSMIIFGQGALRCHPWLLREFAAASRSDSSQAVPDFEQAVFGHVRFLLRNVARSFLLGLTRGRLSAAPRIGRARRYVQHLNWLSAAFALSADVAMMTLGGALKRKERLSARLGDVLSELYLISAALKRFEDQGRSDDDWPLLQWSCENSLYRIQESLRLLFRNLPLRPLGWVVRRLVFPTGYPFTRPDDRLDRDAARVLLTPSSARDRLTRGIFITEDTGYRQGQIEVAFKQARQTEAVVKTLRGAKRAGVIDGDDLMQLGAAAEATGVISAADLAAVMRLMRLSRRVIDVDAFDDYGRQVVLETATAGSPAEHAA